MKIVSLNYQDFAGVSYNLCQAIEEHTDHQAISIRVEDNYIGYPKMVQKGDHPDEAVIQLINSADVVHINDVAVNDLYEEMWRFWLDVDLKDKILIKHHHGTLYDQCKPQFDEYDKKMNAVLVSTPDMLETCGHAAWFPSPVPVSHFRGTYAAKLLERSGLAVSFSDTIKSEEKGKPMVEAVVADLKEKGEADIELLNVRGFPHWVAMTLIARADVNFNQTFPRFATMSALEASCFEKAVIGNPHQEALKILQQYEIEQPYVVVKDQDELRNALLKLAGDPSFLNERGLAAYGYVKRVHDSRVSAERFMKIVEACQKGISQKEIRGSITY